MQGLAIAIGLGCLLMLLVPSAALALLARRFIGPGYTIAGALVGFAIGAVAMMATFFESTFSPPLTLAAQTPADFAHEWVVLVADGATEITWTGSSLPFTSRTAHVKVPASGVVHVKTLGDIDGGDINGRLPRGAMSVGRGTVNLGGKRVVMFCFVPWPGKEPDLGQLTENELAARLAELER